MFMPPVMRNWNRVQPIELIILRGFPSWTLLTLLNMVADCSDIYQRPKVLSVKNCSRNKLKIYITAGMLYLCSWSCLSISSVLLLALNPIYLGILAKFYFDSTKSFETLTQIYLLDTKILEVTFSVACLNFFTLV